MIGATDHLLQNYRKACMVSVAIAMSTRTETTVAARTGRTGVPLRQLKGGDDRGGFEMLMDQIDRIVHIKLWGVWQVSTATDFCSAVHQFGQGFLGKPWSIVADSREFRAQSQEVARLRREAMIDVQRLGCDKIASIGSNVVHAMQFKRIATESHVSSAVFEDETSALEWLHEERRRKA
jgi:hypothetical protein